MIGVSDTMTLWRPTGQAELDLVAASGWREWPPRLADQPIFYPVLNRWYATKIAREWNVPAGGVGHVTQFAVERAHLEQYQVQQVGGRDVLEYWIPAERLAEFNTHIVGAIVAEAEYRGPVDDEEFTTPLPAEWRSYLQGPSWYRRGWLTDETHVWLNSPREMLELQAAWGDSTAAHPGIAIIGGDGARAQLALDLRHDPAPVMLVDIGSSGWDTAVPQAHDVGELIERIEDGTFSFSFAG
ncbi:hypothetical protein GCM10007977_070830 [Dactylosporangium sucinum]|uniref:Uncharacterized protein n=1 Tax=Dactylosporangium sucinum TaxID=1424081 RepID=A0A917U805_9ACTN|nr:hypothetical protein GCM10007977_070830 [Dactylosporangium sucinum]